MGATFPVEAGEVWMGWVPYRDDPSQGKVRPFVTVTSDDGSGEGCLVCRVTSQPKSAFHPHWARPASLIPGSPGWVRGSVMCDDLILIPWESFRFFIGFASWELIDDLVATLPASLRATGWERVLPAVIGALEALDTPDD